jgi:hypothetical protein
MKVSIRMVGNGVSIFNNLEKIGAGERQERVLTSSGHVHDIVVHAEQGSVMSAFKHSTRDEVFKVGYFALEYVG